ETETVRPVGVCNTCQRRLTTKLSDGEMPSQHAGAPALVCAWRSAARGRALYAKRRSLQRRVRRRPFREGTRVCGAQARTPLWYRTARLTCPHDATGIGAKDGRKPHG